MSVWWIIGLILYSAIAIWVFWLIRNLKKDISQRKHYARHPERLKQEFGGLFSDIVCAAFWPLQIIGFLVFLLKL